MAKKYTVDDVKTYAETNSECKLLSKEYINNKQKLSFLCKCGNCFETSFSSFKNTNKRQCNNCSQKLKVNKGVRLIYSEIKQFVEVESNSGCKLLSEEYINNTTKMKIQCKCGNHFTTSFAVFKDMNKRCCDECSRILRRESQSFDYSYVKNFIEHQSDCKLLSDTYASCNEKLKLICKCGKHFKTTFNKFKNRNKRQCNDCSREKVSDIQRKKIEDVKQEFIKRNLIPLFEEYVNRDSKLTAINSEGYLVESSLSSLLQGNTPLVFSHYNKHTISNIKLWLEKNNLKFKLISNTYNKNTDYLTFQCDKGHIFGVLWANFQHRQNCLICNISKGELQVTKWLTKNNIQFESEYTFDDLTGNKGGYLRFDFAVFDKEGNLKYLIEYDGEQHFEHIKGLMTEEDFQRLKNHDERKNQYCRNNNIRLLRLLRIPYWEFDNIEQILDARHSVFFNANF